VSQHFATRQLRFFLTAPTPCPYLPGRHERKVFAHLPVVDGPLVNDTLTGVGFRRSQNIAYRPACEACDACVSARVPAADYVFSKSERRVLQRNDHLQRCLVEAEATREQFDLLRRYLDGRHPGGGMSGMSWPDYVAMVEDTTARTHIVEWRQPSQDNGPGELVGCALVDVLSDGLSLVYSFFDTDQSRNSPGVFAILDHIVQAQLTGIPYVYLGYWVGGSAKMDYKARFRPLELLRFTGWTRGLAAETK
jgi:arginine-tRNA-protein transferase